MSVTNETLDLLKTAQAPLAKAWTQSGTFNTGITNIDLEAPAKSVIPIITPLRNGIPRVSGNGGIQANWKAITGLNTAGISAGVSGGNRGAVITTAVTEYLAAYRGIGLEDSVTWEAQYAAEGFQDILALASRNLLSALMIQEESIILGGNTSVALGTTNTPTVAGSITGGSMTGTGSVNYNVICVALTYQGFRNSSVANGLPLSAARTNADASTDTIGGGTAIKSAAGTGTIASGTSGSMTAVVVPTVGAVAYAWFWGAAGSETLGAITTINSILIKTNAGGGQAAASNFTADNSKNLLEFDGMLTQIFKSGSGAYVATQANGTLGTGTALTGNTDGTIAEIETALQSFWDNYRLSPTCIWVSSQEQKNISGKILAGSSTSAQRFTFNTDQSGIMGGTVVKGYYNRYAMNGATEIPIRLHPNMPAGTIMFDTRELPYALSGISNVLQIRTRQEYRMTEWPMIKRRYEYGVYADEVLQNYFPPAFGMITNIANG